MAEIVRLKEASEQAVAGVNRLLPQLRANAPDEWRGTLQDLQAIASDSNVALFIARDDGRVVGMATLYMIRKFGKRGGFVEDVVVDEAYRGQGLGRKLMEALLATARAERLKQLYLTTNPSRVAAHKLYESLGFQQKETDVYKLTL